MLTGWDKLHGYGLIGIKATSPAGNAQGGDFAPQALIACPTGSVHVSYSLNSLKGVIWGLYRGLLQGLLRGILGVWTIAHVDLSRQA